MHGELAFKIIIIIITIILLPGVLMDCVRYDQSSILHAYMTDAVSYSYIACV